MTLTLIPLGIQIVYFIPNLSMEISFPTTTQVPLGPLDLAMAATSGWSAPEPITKDNFMDALIKFIVSNKLPMTLVEDTTFQSLLNVAQLAQSQEIVRLPSKDTISTKVNQSEASLYTKDMSCLDEISYLKYFFFFYVLYPLLYHLRSKKSMRSSKLGSLMS